MSHQEKYRKIDVTFHRLSDRCIAALVEPEDHSPEWIPLSLLGKLSDRKIEAARPGDQVTVYIMEWKMDELGW